MTKPFDPNQDWTTQVDSIIGLGERSFRKSYYPQLQQNLARLERFRTLLDHTPDILILLDLPAGRIIDANAALGRLLGTESEKMIGRTLDTLGLRNGAAILARLREDMGRTPGTDTHPRTELIPFFDPAKPGWLEVTYTIATQGGEHYGILVGRDITERKRVEEERRRYRDHLEEVVAERTQALLQANQQLEELANTDILTNLPNRRFALSAFTREWDRSSTNNAPLSCMMIDADGFKIINDTYGHHAGDAVLAALSRQLKASVRNDDIVCRLGGDEFLIICPNTPLDGALTLANKVRLQVDQLRVPTGRGEWKGSVSVGVAARDDTMPDLDALIKVADEGVYIAKRQGRNAVGCAAIFAANDGYRFTKPRPACVGDLKEAYDEAH